MVEIRDWLRGREPNGAIQTDIADHFGLQPKACKKLLMMMYEQLWIARARKGPGDNPNAHRWRTVDWVPSPEQAAALTSGTPLEDVMGSNQPQS